MAIDERVHKAAEKLGISLGQTGKANESQMKRLIFLLRRCHPSRKKAKKNVPWSLTKDYRCISKLLANYKGTKHQTAVKVQEAVKETNKIGNPQRSKQNRKKENKKANAKRKKERHEEAKEFCKVHNLTKHLFTERTLETKLLKEYYSKAREELGGLSIDEALDSEDFMLYHGVTLQPKLRDECWRFLSQRGSTPNKTRSGKMRSGGKNRPVLVHLNGSTIKRSFVEKELGGFVFLVDVLKLRLAACQLEDAMQNEAQHVAKHPLPYRLHRFPAKGMKNDKVKEAKEIYKVFVFKINFMYAATDHKNRPTCMFVNVNGHKLRIVY